MGVWSAIFGGTHHRSVEGIVHEGPPTEPRNGLHLKFMYDPNSEGDSEATLNEIVVPPPPEPINEEDLESLSEKLAAAGKGVSLINKQMRKMTTLMQEWKDLPPYDEIFVEEQCTALPSNLLLLVAPPPPPPGRLHRTPALARDSVGAVGGRSQRERLQESRSLRGGTKGLGFL
eukprot:TRINITY_DN14580_c0_g1_i1.p1 TRINITY_DN14580_c0_g1~~TRINITY_DN14580_c0_g1_i1.p1  ORF type:complete len:174 (+),score=39.59 TRINITY_DN14580_c0_g1_i1:231-752(+)